VGQISNIPEPEIACFAGSPKKGMAARIRTRLQCFSHVVAACGAWSVERLAWSVERGM